MNIFSGLIVEPSEEESTFKDHFKIRSKNNFFNKFDDPAEYLFNFV